MLLNILKIYLSLGILLNWKIKDESTNLFTTTPFWHGVFNRWYCIMDAKTQVQSRTKRGCLPKIL